MSLYTHQQKIVDENPPMRLLAWDVGTGKTLAALSLSDKNCASVLIVCPKGMKSQWADKIKEYGIVMHAVIVSKEELRRDFAGLPRFDGVIIDEVHHFSGHSSMMFKNLLKYLLRTQPRFVWGCSATPYRSEPFNIWALGRIHGYMPLDWFKFREHFYHRRYLGQRLIWEKNEDNDTRKKLASYLSHFSDIVKMPDCFDVPDQIDLEPEILDLTKEQKQAVDALKLEEALPIVLIGKRHQIEQGQLKGNEYAPDRQFTNTKDARILELAEEHPKLLIFCRYTLQIKHLALILSKAGYTVGILTGENSADHFALSQQAEKAEKYILIAQTSVAAGWETPSFPLVVFASMSYSYLDYVQSRGRVIRGNKLQKHVFLPLLAGPIDQAVYDCVISKRDFDPATYSS